MLVSLASEQLVRQLNPRSHGAMLAAVGVGVTATTGLISYAAFKSLKHASSGWVKAGLLLGGVAAGLDALRALYFTGVGVYEMATGKDAMIENAEPYQPPQVAGLRTDRERIRFTN